MQPVIDAGNLTHAYDGTPAIRDVSLSVDAGEIFVLIGPNGAGKTTLVRALTGTLTPDHGSISVLDDPVESVDTTRIGLLPQAFSPPMRLTGREIISYYGGLYGNPRPPEDILDDVGMEQGADQWFERLSGGQQRRICVGTALVNNPDLLILDEPTTGIDPRGRRRIWDLLSDLRAGGRTVLLTTHDMVEAETLADRVGFLANGHLVTVGEPSALIERHGGQSRLLVELGEPITAEQSNALPEHVVEGDDQLVFPETDPSEVGDVLDTLEEIKIEFTRFTWEEPTLEDVYFQLTEEEGVA